MLFKYRFFPAIEDGSITLTFRRWKKPQVKAGGRYRLNPNGMLEVTSVRTVLAEEIAVRDANRAGFPDRASLLAFLKPRDGDALYRVEFRFIPDVHDSRKSLSAKSRLSKQDAEQIASRLERMDRLGSRGPWTRETLSLIAHHPRVRAPDLNRKLGWETAPFKANVRKLKALGLTISRDVGYELSPRGRAFLRLTARG